MSADQTRADPPHPRCSASLSVSDRLYVRGGVGYTVRMRNGLLAILLIGMAGCDGPPHPLAAADGPPPSAEPLTIRRVTSDAGASFAFAGAPGTLKVTIEVEGGPDESYTQDYSFEARHSGTIALDFRPEPEHQDGRVAIRCETRSLSSEVVFRPPLWFDQDPATVTFDFPPGGRPQPVASSREIILARYQAGPPEGRRVLLTFKATFLREPIAPRLKAKPRPARPTDPIHP